MNEKVANLRDNTNVYLAGVDRTQSIALDEIFGKKQVDENGRAQTTKTFRKTRVTQTATEGRQSQNQSGTKVTEVEMTTKLMYEEEADDVVVMPTKVTQSEGVCSGEVGRNLLLMSIMWMCSSVNY